MSKHGGPKRLSRQCNVFLFNRFAEKCKTWQVQRYRMKINNIWFLLLKQDGNIKKSERVASIRINGNSHETKRI